MGGHRNVGSRWHHENLFLTKIKPDNPKTSRFVGWPMEYLTPILKPNNLFFVGFESILDGFNMIHTKLAECSKHLEFDFILLTALIFFLKSIPGEIFVP